MTKQELALAEQNAKMREALTDALYWLPEKRHRGGVENGYWEPSGDALLRSRAVVVKALSLPNLATPLLNRLKAEAYREAADIVENIDVYTFVHGGSRYDDGGLTLSSAATAIRAKADELEQSK